MKKTLIPMDNSIESIRVRERGKVKMTVGVRRRTKEKVQYCITAISSE